MPYRKKHLAYQNGLSLVELLIGFSIGLLVIGVATGALIASRSISGTVSDATQIQQQAAYAIRVIGQQLRQAGSLYLEMNPPGFENSVVFLKREGEAITTAADNSSVTTSFSWDGNAASGNCLGSIPAATAVNTPISSTFSLDGSTLRCQGASGTPQPVIDNVADFKIRYLVQTNAAVGKTGITYKEHLDDASDQIQGVEVCLVLYGTERIDMPDGSSYAGCDNTDNGKPEKVDISGERANRMHLTFRNVFQLRPQGEL